MKKYTILIIFFVIVINLFVIIVLTKNINNNKSLKITTQVAMNDVFTKDLFRELVEIHYWNGDEKVIIDNKEDLKTIYKAFTSLKLLEYKSPIKYGHIIIDFITVNDKIGVGLLSDEITVNGINYHTDNDIVSIVRDIALNDESE